MLKVSKLSKSNMVDFAHFLGNIHTMHWSLSSSAFMPKPAEPRSVVAQDIVNKYPDDSYCGVFLLRKNGIIISSLKAEEKTGDQSVIIFSSLETDPVIQKRGIFWMAMGDRCLRNVCHAKYKRIELKTWSFNRKGIPLYKRVGFRAVPGTSLLMENYLPAILKHPDTQPYFAKHDYIRTLKNKRSYGYDAIDGGGMSVFEYRWKPRKAKDSLRVWVDWQKKEIVDVVCLLDEAKNSSEDPDHA
jgi:hypothetical protein